MISVLHFRRTSRRSSSVDFKYNAGMSEEDKEEMMEAEEEDDDEPEEQEGDEEVVDDDSESQQSASVSVCKKNAFLHLQWTSPVFDPRG